MPAGRPVSVQPQLIKMLAAARGAVVPDAVLHAALWPNGARSVSALRMLVLRLRRRMRPGVIERVRGGGYRLNLRTLMDR